MKQFLTPTSKQTYTIAKDFKFLLYPFNLGWREDDGNPFKSVYYETLYGKIDKKGEYKMKMDLVHGPSVDTYEYIGSYNSNKERMSLRECLIVVDSDEEKKSKFIQPYLEKDAYWILGNVPKEATYSIFTDFHNNSKNEQYTIVYPNPKEFGNYKKEEFHKVVSRDEINDIVNHYQIMCDNFKKSELDKFNEINSIYTIRFDKISDNNIPIEYTLAPGVKFKFIKFGVKPYRHSKKKDFVEIEIGGHRVHIREEDFSGIWVE
jgi:hypothetical protein